MLIPSRRQRSVHTLPLHFEHSGITGLQFLEIFPEFPYGAEGLSVEGADHVTRSEIRRDRRLVIQHGGYDDSRLRPKIRKH